MTGTPRALRPHIVIAGKCNAGKSSLINSLTGRQMAIVSETAGTTTDPVYKAMEFPPFGPVVFVDTAGLDDRGTLGDKRIASATGAAASADMLLYVVDPGRADTEDLRFLADLRAKQPTDPGTPVIVVQTFAEKTESGVNGGTGGAVSAELARLGIPVFPVSNRTGTGMDELKAAVMHNLENRKGREPTLLQDLVKQYQLIMLIVPIDLEAPAGRLILPQVQTIREALDDDASIIVVKEREVDWMLKQLNRPPDLAITDSQVVLKACGSVPVSIPLTTFSILFSRLKGDLPAFVQNVRTIDGLDHGDRVLLTESCAHHAHCDDIARVKIPRWLRQYTGKELDVAVSSGQFPDDVEGCKLVIHCGACMITRRAMQSRLAEASAFDVPVTNYGVAISYLQGVLDRVVSPFAAELGSIPGDERAFCPTSRPRV